MLIGRRASWLVPLLGIAACTGTGTSATAAHNPMRSAAPSRPAPPVATVALAPQSALAVWQLRGFTFTTGTRTQATLDVGKSVTGGSHDELRQVAVVFPRPLLDPSCVARATLTLTVTGGHHLDQAELGVYPSGESNYLGFAHVPNSDLDLSALVDNRPRGYVSVVATGQLRIDITDLYRTWAAGGPFPSDGATVDRSWPIGVVVRPPAADAGNFDAFIANGQHAPSLEIVKAGDCHSPGG